MQPLPNQVKLKRIFTEGKLYTYSMQLIYFFILFATLFFLSRVLTATISNFFFHLTRNYTVAIQLLSILFLPGVILHELAHWLFASILFVPTGEIEFFPQAQGNSVKLGSVQIAQTDPFRRFIIGIAPVIFGLGVILLLFSFFLPSLFSFSWQTVLFAYIVFEIGNTMFSSKKDLEGVIIFVILSALFLTLLFFLKVPILALLQQFAQQISQQAFLYTLNVFLFIAIGIDMLGIGLFSLLVRVFRR